jgi:L-serine dehydratase
MNGPQDLAAQIAENHESISAFDILKIGIGPSSSHTLGPWRAVRAFLLENEADLPKAVSIQVDLYGSLAKTGRGHGTDLAVQWGISGLVADACDPAALAPLIARIKEEKSISLLGRHPVEFHPARHVRLNYKETLESHPNGMRFALELASGEVRRIECCSVGGGFFTVVGREEGGADDVRLPHPMNTGADVQRWCDELGLPIHEVVRRNELAWRSEAQVSDGLDRIVEAMASCIWRGLNESGELPGGLQVVRKAPGLARSLWSEIVDSGPEDLLPRLRSQEAPFEERMDWITAFAFAVNEENAAFGRVVTAPTNGAAGVIPAVLFYYLGFIHRDTVTEAEAARRFLLTCAEIGSLYKKGATISAAMGGCQAEIGVSSSMAAAGLCEALGGSAAQALMAAEVAMEHHLGMTCDPVNGLVQIPCIERNSFGALKAIAAARLALRSRPSDARVSLDQAIATMWRTAQDMNEKYRETSEGGLAISLALPEC